MRRTDPLLFCVIAGYCLTFAARLPAQQTIPSPPPAFWSWAATPPMGWNSYDAYGDTVTEKEVLANAQYMKDHLLTHGWNYVVIDFRWYDPDPTGDDLTLNQKRTGAKLAADAFGRMLPAENRFPSAANGMGFKPLADQIHAMGLKFGFHMMRGIPRQAVNAATPIEGSTFTAADAGDPRNKCGWCPDMYGVKANPAGQAWYDSMFRLYAAWDLDYIKVDDLSVPYQRDEIEMIRHAIDHCGRHIVFSTSPGPTVVRNAEHVETNANLWRISGDFWDRWKKLDAQFDLLASWRDTGGPGHWPDADMIPFGRIAIRSKRGGDDHHSNFTKDEQTTLLTLWAMAPSPLMLGGNLPDNDAWDLSLLTNDEVLAINQDALGKQAVRVSQSAGNEVWVKELSDGAKAVALFNRGQAEDNVTLNWADAKFTGLKGFRDVWRQRDLGRFSDEFKVRVPAHGAVMMRVTQAADAAPGQSNQIESPQIAPTTGAVYLAKAANGIGIPDPTSTKTYPVHDQGRTILVPEIMAYIPAGICTIGESNVAKTVQLGGYCIGRYDVTNAEYKVFLDANVSHRPPGYWSNGMYPEGKANHPVVYISLNDAFAYANWVSAKTGSKVTIPTADQWEKAARGPKGYLYPWGNTSEVRLDRGEIVSRFNFNAVIAAQCLRSEPKRIVTYDNERSKYFGKKTAVDQIAAYDAAGNPQYLSISPNGAVAGWVNHDTYTGFIYTDLFTHLNSIGGNTSAVGSYEDGKSAYGCYDMAGNVWNWCNSTIISTNGAERGRTVNEIRGGSWYATGNSCKSVSIGEGRAAGGVYNTVGFRIIVLTATTER